MLSQLKVRDYKEIRNLKVQNTNKTLYGTVKEILFKDEVSFQLGIKIPCYIRQLSKNPRSYIETEISIEVFDEIKNLEKNIIKEVSKSKIFSSLIYNKPIIYEKEPSSPENFFTKY